MSINKNSFLPVILGGDFAAYSLARTFHEEYNVKAVAVCTQKGWLNTYTDIMDTIIEPDFTEKDVFLKTLIKIAERHGKDKKLLLMGSRDWHIRMICENHETLDKYFIVPYISEELLNKLVLKDSFYELCDEYGVNYPRTFVYDFKEDNELDLPFDFPVVAKPASSAEWYYESFEGQKKVYILKSMEELKEVISNIRERSSYSYKLLIQDFIPGDDTYMHILTCYCDKNSKVRFAAFGHTMLEDQGENSIGNPAVIINDTNPQVVEEASRFLEAIGYVGYGNFDIKYDERDGRYKFFEINTRLGSSNYYITGSGFNTVKWIVDEYIEGKTFDGEKVIADKEHMYTVVPESTIVRYLELGKNEELKKKVQRLFREGKASVPIDYSGDRNLIHKLYVRYYMHHQKKRFEEYF